MLENYYKKNKSTLLPWVKDWTDPQNQLRFSKNVKAMSYNEWYFCHPSAYKLMTYGGNVLGIVIGVATMFFFGRLISILLSIFVLALAWDLFKKMRYYSSTKTMTYYDLFMREDKDGS